MTIQGAWVEAMKEECPEAFSKTVPFIPNVAFLDGMIMLMKADTVTRWRELIDRNFVSSVKAFFRLGAAVVVLGFDDYTYVSKAKSITQHNRSKKAVAIDFTSDTQLPAAIPVDYSSCMRNREFKLRVMQLIVETLPGLLDLQMGQTFIVDYRSCPIQFKYNVVTNKVDQSFVTDMPALGECDIKWTRWFEKYGDGIASSTDGDFIPIALMNHEAQLRKLAGGVGIRLYQVALYRGEYKMSCDKPKTTGKRKSAKDGACAPSSSAVAAVPEKVKLPKKKEYVNVHLLYESLAAAMKQASGTAISARNSHETRYMELLACLIAFTGTDFTRGLPRIGVKKLWNMLPDKRVWPGVIQAYDVEAKGLDINGACDGLVARLYAEVYSKHVRNDSTLSTVLRDLQTTPKISVGVKAGLPSVARVATTAKNANWLLQYWRCEQPVWDELSGVWVRDIACPDPISDQYGFKLNQRGVVEWLDA